MIVRLMRHPAIDTTRERCIGQTDAELSPNGRESLDMLAQKASAFEAQRILCSDLKRCRVLAEEVSLRTRIAVEVVGLWREVNFGAWENRTWDEIRSDDPEGFEHWVQNFTEIAPPQGESFLILQQRALEGLRKLEGTAHENVLIVTHAGLIRALLCSVTGFPEKRAFDIPAPYGSHACLRWESRQWRYEVESGSIQMPPK